MAAGGGSSLDPTEQFGVHTYVPIHVFGHDFSFTNSALYMFIVVGLIALLMIVAVSKEAIVPGRLQAMAEMAYEFNADMLRQTTGKPGMVLFAVDLFDFHVHAASPTSISLDPLTRSR